MQGAFSKISPRSTPPYTLFDSSSGIAGAVTAAAGGDGCLSTTVAAARALEACFSGLFLCCESLALRSDDSFA